jgi:hypothetical protein
MAKNPADPAEIATANDLLKRWRAHENDKCAAVNTLIAIFKLASPIGRFCDKFTYLNPPYAMWLEDFIYDRRTAPDDRDTRLALDQQPRSQAATAMIEHRLTREHRRCVPLTATARTALTRYYEEKLGLLAETETLFKHDRRIRNHAARHARDCRAVLEQIGC